MAPLKALLDKAFAIIRESTRYVCTICGTKVADAEECASCGVVACPHCQSDDACPYCGEPL